MAEGDLTVHFLSGGQRFPASDSLLRYEVVAMSSSENHIQNQLIFPGEALPLTSGVTLAVDSIVSAAYTLPRVDFIDWDYPNVDNRTFVYPRTLTSPTGLAAIKIGTGTTTATVNDTDLETAYSPSKDFGIGNTAAQRRNFHYRIEDGKIYILLEDTTTETYTATEMAFYDSDGTFFARLSVPTGHVVQKRDWPLYYLFRISDDGWIIADESYPLTWSAIYDVHPQDVPGGTLIGDPYAHRNYLRLSLDATHPVHFTGRNIIRSIGLVGSEYAIWGLSPSRIPVGTILGDTTTAGANYLRVVTHGLYVRLVVRELGATNSSNRSVQWVAPGGRFPDATSTDRYQIDTAVGTDGEQVVATLPNVTGEHRYPSFADHRDRSTYIVNSSLGHAQRRWISLHGRSGATSALYPSEVRSGTHLGQHDVDSKYMQLAAGGEPARFMLTRHGNYLTLLHGVGGVGALNIESMSPADIPTGMIIGSTTAGNDYLAAYDAGQPVRLCVTEL